MALTKRQHTWIAIAAVAVIGGFFWYRSSHKVQDIRYITATAHKATLVAALTGTGQVNAQNKIDIKPETSGKIISVPVTLGQRVKAGQVIATLDQKSALVSYRQALASVQSSQANYNKVIGGTDSTEIQLAKLSLATAQSALKNAQDNVVRVQTQQDTAVANAQRSLMNSTFAAVPATNNLSAGVPTISGVYTGTEQGTYQISLYQGGNGMHYLVRGLENFDGLMSSTNAAPLGTHGLSILFPSTVNIADTWSVAVPNTQASNYLSNYNAYQTALQNRVSALASADQSVVSAQNNVDQAQLALEQKQLAAKPEDVALARAQLSTTQAQLLAAQTTLANTTVRAPFDGQIAVLPMQRGEEAGSGSAIATLITQQQVAKITLNEVDAAKVQNGLKATLAFDAIDNLTIAGHVAGIDPVGTVTQGVVSYGVTIALDTPDDRIKDGMSVTASIILDSKADTLAVPAGAVKSQGDTHYVEMFDPGVTFTTVAGVSGAVPSQKPKRQSVEIGISSDSLVEITSGLSEGDVVVTQTIDPNTAKAPAAASTGLRLPGVGGGGGNRAAGGGR